LKILLTLLALSVLSGCASTVKISALPGNDTEQIFRAGIPSLMSKKKHVVMISPEAMTRPNSSRPTFILSVTNLTDKSIEVDTTSVTASLDGKSLKVFTFDEVQAEIKRRQAISAALVAFGGALQASAAQQQASYSQYGGQYNTGAYSGTYQGWSYNPAAGQAAANAVNMQTQQNLSSIRQSGESALREAASNLLQRTTLLPGKSYGGKVVFANVSVEKEGGRELIIDVDLRDEVHSFRFLESVLPK
jgi:hypothetical protein